MMVALAVLVLIVAVARNHDPAEAALLLGAGAAAVLLGRLLVRDFRRHPSNFPEPTPSQGLALDLGGTGRSRWASQTRAGGPW
jgi:hypothetical protein